MSIFDLFSILEGLTSINSMSLTNVYCRNLSDKLLPELKRRLNEYEMIVDLHPDFSFYKPIGFFQFKFKVINPHLEILKDKEFSTDFDYNVDAFDFKSQNRKDFDDFSFANREIQSNLRNCDRKVSFFWPGGGDSFQQRFAFLTSAVLTELTNGIWCYPEDIIWHNRDIVSNGIFERIKEYEQDLIKFEFKEFLEWK